MARIDEQGNEIPDPPKPPVEPIPAPIQPSPDPIEQKPVPKSPDLIQPDAPQAPPYFPRPPQLSAPAETAIPEPPSQPASPAPIAPPEIPPLPAPTPLANEPDAPPASQPLPPPFTYTQPPEMQPMASAPSDGGMPPAVYPEPPEQLPMPQSQPLSASLQHQLNEARNQIQLIWAQLNSLRSPASINMGAIRYGKAKTTWSSTNTIVVTPVVSATNNTTTGEADVTVYIDSPSGADPKKLVIALGDILAFLSPLNDKTIGNLLPVLVKFDSVTVAADPTTATVPLDFNTQSGVVTGLTNGSATASGGISANGSCDGNGNVTLTGTVTITIGGVITGASGTTTVLKSVLDTTSVVTGFSNTPLVLRAPSGW